MENKVLSALELIQEYLLDVMTEAIEQRINKPTIQVIDNQPERLLNFKDMCTLLQISQTTGHKWKRQGLLPFHRLGGKIFFKENEVIESLKSINRRKL